MPPRPPRAARRPRPGCGRRRPESTAASLVTPSVARVSRRIDSRRLRQRRQISQSSTTASMPSAHGTGHGTFSGPNAIPATNRAIGGSDAELAPARAQRDAERDDRAGQHEHEGGHQQRLVVADRQGDREQLLPAERDARRAVPGCRRDSAGTPRSPGPAPRAGRRPARDGEADQDDDERLPAEHGSQDRDDRSEHGRDRDQHDEPRILVDRPERDGGDRRRRPEQQRVDAMNPAVGRRAGAPTVLMRPPPSVRARCAGRRGSRW